MFLQLDSWGEPHDQHQISGIEQQPSTSSIIENLAMVFITEISMTASTMTAGDEMMPVPQNGRSPLASCTDMREDLDHFFPAAPLGALNNEFAWGICAGSPTIWMDPHLGEQTSIHRIF